jgi:hypothetical protein
MGKDEYTNSVDVFTLQEMRWTGTGIMDQGRHVILYSGHQKKHEFGVGLLVNNRIKDSIIGFILINHRLCIIRTAGIFFNPFKTECVPFYIRIQCILRSKRSPPLL